MKIYDISQELFTSNVYPNDPKAEKEIICSIENGDLYNLSYLKMCVHNGTHIDAPRHFIKNGKTIDQIPLESLIGPCFVIEFNGELTKEDVISILNRIEKRYSKRILFKGDVIIGKSASEEFAKTDVLLLGIESQSFGPVNSPMEVHKILLGKDIILLEGLNLKQIKEGRYLLNAAPINLGDTEGAPCRAILIEE